MPMAYHPQPGTTPFRAVAWLRSMAKVSPGRKVSTVELCEAIGVETDCFTAYMASCRAHGLVHAEHQPGTKVLLWSLGEGQPVDLHAPRERDEPLSQAVHVPERRGEMFPGVAANAPLPSEFRALEWDGHLLVTGMEIRDGVAIFGPEQVLALKRHTDWWKSA